MTTLELQGKPSDAAYVAKLRASPAGEMKLVPGGRDACAYGPVEVAWYPDRLMITALGAGSTSITQAYLSDKGEDVIVEIRLPSLDELLEDELIELMPGAD